jgi:endonuclease G
MIKLLTLPLLLSTCALFAQVLPVKMDRTNQIKEYNGFTVSYNELHEQSNWVLYTLKKENLFCTDLASRKNNFKDDFTLETASAYDEDYIRSGYDRGHLKAAADEPCNQEKMDETFKMVNICPQNPSFNRGIWRKLENYVRNITLEHDSIVVITGPILSPDLKKIKDVSVPEHFFKILYLYKDGVKTIVPYFIDNKKSSYDLEEFIVPLSFINKMSGFEFPD